MSATRAARPTGQARSVRPLGLRTWVAPATSSRPRHRQEGASLLVVLALLLAIGLLTLTGFQLARHQYLLVSNLQFQEQAFTQAETAVAVAEAWLSDETNANLPAFETFDAAAKGLYPMGHLGTLGLDPVSMTWTSSNSLAAGSARYLIEQTGRSVRLPGGSLQVGQATTGACRAVDLFHVVGRSASVRGSSRTIETYFATDACR